jgi:hypothetical protein
LTGLVALGEGSNAAFASSLERDWLIALDFDPWVRSIHEQPFSLFYEFEGGVRRYTPDVMAEAFLPSGEVVTTVYEVKPREELVKDWKLYRPRFKAAVKFCRERGWRFKIVTENELRTPFVRNARFLRRYRSIAEQVLLGKQLCYTLKSLGETTPQALLAAAFLTTEYRMAALSELWRLVATRKILAMFDEDLTMHSAIWLPEK